MIVLLAFIALNRNQTLTFSLQRDDRTQHSVHLANQANWRAGHCVLYIFPKYDQLNAL